jgi:hypothetical protein
VKCFPRRLSALFSLSCIADSSTSFSKAPHHTVVSWTSHWHSRHEIADKILAAAKGELTSESSSVSLVNSPNEPPTARRLHYHEDSSSASGFEDIEESASEVRDGSGSNYSDGSDMVDVNTDEDIEAMGEGGGPFTKADTRVVARYIASNPDWDSRTGRSRWEPFEKMV